MAAIASCAQLFFRGRYTEEIGYKGVWQLTFGSYLDYLKYSPQKLVFYSTVVVDGTAKNLSELIKAALD